MRNNMFNPVLRLSCEVQVPDLQSWPFIASDYGAKRARVRPECLGMTANGFCRQQDTACSKQIWEHLLSLVEQNCFSILGFGVLCANISTSRCPSDAELRWVAILQAKIFASPRVSQRWCCDVAFIDWEYICFHYLPQYLSSVDHESIRKTTWRLHCEDLCKSVWVVCRLRKENCVVTATLSQPKTTQICPENRFFSRTGVHATLSAKTVFNSTPNAWNVALSTLGFQQSCLPMQPHSQGFPSRTPTIARCWWDSGTNCACKAW